MLAALLPPKKIIFAVNLFTGRLLFQPNPVCHHQLTATSLNVTFRVQSNPILTIKL